MRIAIDGSSCGVPRGRRRCSGRASRDVVDPQATFRSTLSDFRDGGPKAQTRGDGVWDAGFDSPFPRSEGDAGPPPRSTTSSRQPDTTFWPNRGDPDPVDPRWRHPTASRPPKRLHRRGTMSSRRAIARRVALERSRGQNRAVLGETSSRRAAARSASRHFFRILRKSTMTPMSTTPRIT